MLMATRTAWQVDVPGYDNFYIIIYRKGLSIGTDMV